MTEDSIQQNEEAVPSQTDEQNESVLDNSDYKAMLLEETQQSKKYRKRAQKAEAKILEYQKQQEKDKIATMKENEQYKELSVDLQSKLDNALPYKEKWKAHEQAQREEYLSKLPEEDRETLSTKDTDTLKFLVKKVGEHQTVNPKHTAGQSRNVNNEGIIPETGNPFEQLSNDVIKNNWGDVLNKYTKNKNN